jgi:hypothetical protein
MCKRFRWYIQSYGSRISGNIKTGEWKGGYYLVKNDWHDIELENLISSNKPTENSNEVGILYMAFSAIPDVFFEEYDTTNNIFKFEYTGLPYAITEVFEDSNLLTQQSSLEFMQSTTLITALTVNGSETEVVVNSTSSFGDSGSIYIDDEQIDYTSKTATQFEGCTRGAGSTIKLSHTSGTVVNPKKNASCLLTTALITDGSETTVSVNNTTGFDNSGTIFVNGEEITYTSKTTTSFVGCIRSANGWTKENLPIGTVITHNTNISGWYHDVDNRTLYIRCSDGAFPYYHVISVPYIWDSQVPIRLGNFVSSVYNPPIVTVYSGGNGTTISPDLQPPTGGTYLKLVGTGTAGNVIITGVADDASVTETILATTFDSNKIAFSTKKWVTISNLNISTWTSMVIQSSAPKIAYWETANGDVPLDTLENLLTALNLEYEPVFRNGICRIDVSEKIGSGSVEFPANYYNEQDNIIAVQEIDMADARNMINGVWFTGYGSGAARVKSGKHINRGRGGRFVLLDDSSIHSQAVADGFVEKYLDDHYLPTRSIKFSSPLVIGDTVDQRRLGDTAHISIPSEFLEQDLRITNIAIKLKPLSQTLTFGDKLISWDDQIKAMRSASEKYRKHLQDEIEEFGWSWTENLDSTATRESTFDITSDALKVQKLELTCTTDFHTTDTSLGSGSGGGGGGGGGGSEDNPAGTISSTTHHHQVVGVTAVPSATVAVAEKYHYHSLNSIVSSVPSATVAVAEKYHYHFLNSIVSSVPSATVAVASSTHYHALSNLASGGPSSTVEMATSSHNHQFTVAAVASSSVTSVATSSHTHTYTSTSATPSGYVNVAGNLHTHTVSVSGTPTTNSQSLVVTVSNGLDSFACCTGINCGKQFVTASRTHTATVPNHSHSVNMTIGGTTGTPSAGSAVATSDHTHTVSGTTFAGSSAVNVSSSSHTHVVSGSTISTTTTTTVASSSHTHTISGNTEACNAPTTVASSGHTHTITGNTEVCNAQDVAASSSHTHTTSGNTEVCNAQEVVATYDHTHQINFETSDAEAGTATYTAPQYISQFTYKTQGGILTNLVTGRPYDTGDPVYDTYRENPDYRFKATDIYTCFRGGGNPDLDPEMYLYISISGPGIVGDQEITGSPFVIRISDDIGTVLIDNLVKESGTFTVKIRAENKDDSEESVYLKFNMQISGQIFVDTIIKG